MNYSKYSGSLIARLSSDQPHFKCSVPTCGWGHFTGSCRSSSFNFQAKESPVSGGGLPAGLCLPPPMSSDGAQGSVQVLGEALLLLSRPQAMTSRRGGG